MAKRAEHLLFLLLFCLTPVSILARTQFVAQTLLCPFTRKSGARMGPCLCLHPSDSIAGTGRTVSRRRPQPLRTAHNSEGNGALPKAIFTTDEHPQALVLISVISANQW